MFFSVGGPLALVVASVVGWLVAGAALRPVERMRQQASAISASGPDERLTLPDADDEIRRLAQTLNDDVGAARRRVRAERRFLDNASHELRTPLTALKAELDLARARPRDATELRAALDSASEEADRLARLAEDPPGGHEDVVGREPGDEAEEDAPHHDFGEALPRGDFEELDHDVEDRPGGECEEREKERVVDERSADDGPDERGASADQPGRRKEAPTRAFAYRGHRADDAEAFGRVVQAEPDDEQQRESDLALRCRLTDREPFGEVVEPDADRDEHGESLRVAPLRHGRRELVDVRGAGTEPSLASLDRAFVVDEPDQPGPEARREHGRQADEAPPAGAVVLCCKERVLDRFVRVAEHIEEQEDEDADRDGVQAGAQLRCRVPEPPEREAEEDRETGDRREHPEARRRDVQDGEHPVKLGQPYLHSNSLPLLRTASV